MINTDVIVLSTPEIAGLPYVISGLVAAGGLAAASIDNRVDALMRVRSGGRRSGIHSYSSDRSPSQPGGIRPRCIAVIR